ncbi:hypothetical protein [Otariodibacter oris]|uniref:Domain amino terminal to FKBP-type peptidyl-prolyl isomerase n=1 Tax=Otariodibacter oris TaxID=1032623 RepID=A0A420XGT9_9PAST|nr:hypothetical protein [Otariodibacter oris]QGM81183.1 hypothetical protein A6A10_07065 [Otariodibacter oris]RKR72740.1 hypothetical protein DES31_0905 [Otariodibacter oris]
MKHCGLKHFFSLVVVLALSACSLNEPTGWTRLANDQIDQKSYAIGYGATAQTYLDRVNQSFDIDSFTRGVDDWYSQRVTLPIEQIRASLLNRMLDHDVYAYYSGVLYAAELQGNANRLSPKCWSFVEPKSTTQGINDAMVDLQKNQVRDDDYIKEGAEEILHLCVAQVEKDQAVPTK